MSFFANIPGDVLRRRDISPMCKLVYGLINGRQGKRECVWLGLRDIAFQCGGARSTATEAVERLREVELIAIERGDWQERRSNRYRVLPRTGNRDVAESGTSLKPGRGRIARRPESRTPRPDDKDATSWESGQTRIKSQKNTHAAVCVGAAPGEKTDAHRTEIRTLLQGEGVVKLEVAELAHVTLAATLAVVAEAPRGKNRAAAIVRTLESPEAVRRLLNKPHRMTGPTPDAEQTRRSFQRHREAEAVERASEAATAERVKAVWDTMSPDDRNAVTRRAWEQIPAIVRPPLESVLADPWESPNLRPHLISELRKLTADDTTDTQTETSQPDVKSKNQSQICRSA